MMRRPRALLLFAGLALVMAACGPGARQTSSPGAAGSPGEGDGGGPSGNLFAHGVSYATTDTHGKARVDLFRELYPDVRVGYSESNFDAQVFLAALQGADAPDVVRMSRQIIGSYIHRGVLAPLDDCLEQQDVDTSIYQESAMAQVTVDGTVYALPDFFNTVLWVVNDPAFQEAGLDPAAFDWSDWEAISAANQALLRMENGALSRIGIDPKLSPEGLGLWAAANGGRLLSEDGTESLLDTPEVVGALEFGMELIDAHGGGTAFLDFRGSPESGDPFGAENQYVLDTVGAAPWEQFYISVLAGASPDVEISGHAFLGVDGEPVTWQTGDALAIVEGTDNFDAACAFVTTMVSTDAWVRAAEARKAERDAEDLPYTGVYSANREATEQIFADIVDLSGSPEAFGASVQVVLDTQESAVGFPPSPAGEECFQAIRTAVDDAMTGVPAAEALATADEECQSAIDDAGG